MEDIAGKLNQILADPEALSRIMSLAQSFGAGDAPAPEPSCDSPKESGGFSMPDEKTMQMLLGVLSEANRSGGKEEALFRALKPFVSPKRCEKMDRAAEIARISHIAGCALRSFGDKKQPK